MYKERIKHIFSSSVITEVYISSRQKSIHKKANSTTTHVGSKNILTAYRRLVSILL